MIRSTSDRRTGKIRQVVPERPISAGPNPIFQKYPKDTGLPEKQSPQNITTSDEQCLQQSYSPSANSRHSDRKHNQNIIPSTHIHIRTPSPLNFRTKIRRRRKFCVSFKLNIKTFARPLRQDKRRPGGYRKPKWLIGVKGCFVCHQEGHIANQRHTEEKVKEAIRKLKSKQATALLTE